MNMIKIRYFKSKKFEWIKANCLKEFNMCTFSKDDKIKKFYDYQIGNENFKVQVFSVGGKLNT